MNNHKEKIHSLLSKMLAENLTKEDEKIISDLRLLIKHEYPEVAEDKLKLYKFLKARNFNVKQAEVMLKKNLEWRKALQVDNILTDYTNPEVLKQHISQSFVGFDKEGRPVRYAALGSTDGRGIFRSANRANVLRCILQVIEEDLKVMKLQSKKHGKLISECVYIYDMENMSLAKATHTSSIQLFMDGVNIFQDNYPELLKNIYVINAQLYFTIAFTLIKTILQGEIISKIRVFGQDGWKEELLKIIDADVLPGFLGGNRTDPDGNPRCFNSINFAGNVPETYYLTKDIERFAKSPDVKMALIERQAMKTVSVEVETPGSILHWEFESAHNDIGFGLMYENRWGINKEIIIPVHKVSTDYEPETGHYRCSKSGYYILVFDNAYSWFLSKDVYYKTWVKDSTEFGVDQ